MGKTVNIVHRLKHDVEKNGKWVRSWTHRHGDVIEYFRTLSGIRFVKIDERCKEGGKEQQRYPRYAGTTNNFKDFQEFVEWSQSEYGYDSLNDNGTLWHIEKDIIGGDKKQYSPETCLFVPSEVNTFLCLAQASRGQYPIGVCEKKGRFEAYCNNSTSAGKYVGASDTPLGAHVFWQLAKVTHGRSLCDKYKEHTKMVEGLSAWLDKIEQDRLAGRESVFL